MINSAFDLIEISFFAFFIASALALDLWTHRREKTISLQNAIVWSALWIGLAVIFSGWIHERSGPDAASLFLAAYVLEKSLSVDNLFVFLAVFASFGVAERLQHRILHYGILGAMLLRLIFIAAGSSVLVFGDWALIAFSLIVLWSAWQLFTQSNDDEPVDYTTHWSVRLTQRWLPVEPKLHGSRFLVRINKRWHLTPLFLCLVCIEVADILFAFDSVPAVIALAQDPWLIYTSNIFAILGLRSLYFCLAAAKRYLIHLEKAVIIVLIFVGVKIPLSVFDIQHFSAASSLIIILSLLAAGAAASIIFPERKPDQAVPGA